MSDFDTKTFLAVERTIVEMIAHQEARVRRLAARVVPEVTLDDLLSPDDVPRLASDPEFMYEDGTLAGLMSAHTALRALMRSRCQAGDEEADSTR